MEKFNPVFEYFSADISQSRPKGELTLEQFIVSIEHCKLKSIFDEIKRAEETGDLELKSELKKEKLYYVTPCVHFGGGRRRYKDIKNFTGLMVLDFDHLTFEESVKLKKWLFEKYPQVICAYLSPSRHGVKALVRIPVCDDVDEFKSYFYGMAAEIGNIKGFDGSGQNPSLPLFVSLDSEVLFREDAVEWDIFGEKIGDYSTSKPTPPPANFKPDDKDLIYIKKWLNKKINEITNNAHPQILSIAVTLGGYVGYGYLSAFEAEQLIEYEIRSNMYMTKKANRGQVYVNTSRQMIAKGASKPLPLPFHGNNI